MEEMSRIGGEDALRSRVSNVVLFAMHTSGRSGPATMMQVPSAATKPTPSRHAPRRNAPTMRCAGVLVEVKEDLPFHLTRADQDRFESQSWYRRDPHMARSKGNTPWGILKKSNTGLGRVCQRQLATFIPLVSIVSSYTSSPVPDN